MLDNQMVEARVQVALDGLMAVPAENPIARGSYIGSLCASQGLEMAAAVLKRYGEVEGDGPLVMAEFLRNLVADEGPGPGDMMTILNSMCYVFRKGG